MRGLFFVCVLAICFAAACHETGDVEVQSMSFSGNTAIPSEQLKAIVATKESGSLPWQPNHYFDRTEFDRDVKRIESFYADRGYPNAKVTGVDVQFNDKRDKAGLRINISEGSPVVVERVDFEGFDGLDANVLSGLESELPFKEGTPRDQQLIKVGHDVALNTLRDEGFPYASVTMEERPGGSPDKVDIVVKADPGPRAVFGPISIEGHVTVDENVIRRQLAFKPGDVYRLSAVTESQRHLYRLELFQFANITPKMREERSTDVPMVVTVVEGKHRRLRLAVGYGSEEKARASANWRHVNFYGGARTAEVEAKWSRLEQGIRGSFLEPYFFAPDTAFRLSGSTWWADEPTYTYRSFGGRAIVTRQIGHGGAGANRGIRSEFRGSYIREFQTYAISNKALADLSLRDDLIALGLDPRTGTGTGTLSSVDIDFDRNTSAQPLDPRQGYATFFHLEHAGGGLGGDFRYDELMLEGRRYLPFGDRLVWANRARFGTLMGADSAEIPFFKRYFVGGSSSVRGWGRFQVSPLSGTGLPIGGRTLMEVSTEARVRLTSRMSGVVFLDGGNVWTDPWQIEAGDMRWAAGPGLRYDTPVGPFRIDLGIQLNPISGLLINGQPEQRRWRVHFSIGQAF